MTTIGIRRAVGWALLTSLVCGAGLGSGWMVWRDGRVQADEPASTSARTAQEEAAEAARVPLEVARDRAKLMHEVYVAALEAMHQRYFHGDRAVVPARAMEDVFADMRRKHLGEARWISASFQPMSLDHEPETEFEKKASREIARGEEAIELIEGGYYRRAGRISLHGGCITCHQGSIGPPSPGKKSAALVISLPIRSE
jgi:hypothetical protein